MSYPLHTVAVKDGSALTNPDRLELGFLNGVASPASANAVTVLGSITAGSGYTNLPNLAPNGGTGSGLTAVATSLKAVSATVVNQGTSGYAVNDTITLTNGVVLTVATVSSGKVATVTVTTPGNFTSIAANPVAQASTSGSGVGTPTFNLSYGLGSAAITNSGNYTGAPSMSVTPTDGNGSGAAIGTCTLGGNGNPVFVGITQFQLPGSYNVQVEPGMNCQTYVPPALKTNSGFTVALVPPTTTSTLSAGTFDVTVIS